jgi:hypothetical protein
LDLRSVPSILETITKALVLGEISPISADSGDVVFLGQLGEKFPCDGTVYVGKMRVEDTVGFRIDSSTQLVLFVVDSDF